MNFFISKLISSSPIKNISFFKALEKRSMSKDKFIFTQIALLKAVEYFSIPMFIIASKLDSYKDRNNIIENIVDEHGNGKIDKAHGKTFEAFLFSFGVTKEMLNNCQINDVVKTFNESLYRCANNESTFRSIAMMGIIEERYSEISLCIVRAILDQGWIDKKKLTHYSLHGDLDVEHAYGFYNIIENGWGHQLSKEEIKKGLILGNNLICDLYDDLFTFNR